MVFRCRQAGHVGRRWHLSFVPLGVLSPRPPTERLRCDGMRSSTRAELASRVLRPRRHRVSGLEHMDASAGVADLYSMCCLLLFCSNTSSRLSSRYDPPGVPYSYFILRPTLPPCCHDARSKKPKQRTEIDDDDVDVQSGAAWKAESETLKL